MARVRAHFQWIFVLAVFLAWSDSFPIMAQSATGNVHATVRDGEGIPLPGATCELQGLGADQRRVTTSIGEARWLNLDPGVWTMNCTLDGFSPVEVAGIDVGAARSTSLEVLLTGAITEIISVTAEHPLLDERKLSTGTSVTQVELETLPTGNDPWAVLNQAPGVLVTSINVGGSESGQQAGFRAPGVSHDENVWIVDGVEIGQMNAARGSSPTYYDFNQFVEMQIETGGTDITKAAAGVSVNLVTKRGTNQFRGSARFFYADDDMFNLLGGDIPVRVQPDPDLAPGQESFVGNTVDQINEYGFEAGGPAIPDRLWFWGSWGVNDIKQRTGGATLADVESKGTSLENTALRVNAQISQANSFVGSWNEGVKELPGATAGLNFEGGAILDQRGPQTSIVKLEDTHVVNSSLFLSGIWSKIDNKAEFECRACQASESLESTPESTWNADGVWQRSFQSGRELYPQGYWKLEGSYFFSLESSSHELKLGGRRRDWEESGQYPWPGRNLFTVDLALFNPDLAGLMYVVAARGEIPLVSEQYTSLWLQDTISLGSWTLNAGLRYDLQSGANESNTVPGNPAFPEVLPPVEYAGADMDFDDWESISPRVGVTYALGEERKTLIRASYARFAEQLASNYISRTNPLGFSYAYYYAHDVNRNLIWEEEIDELLGLGYCWNCGQEESPNRVDPNLAPSMTDEVILGFDHSFFPELVLAATLTWRSTSDVKSNYGASVNREMIIDPVTGQERASVAADYVLDTILTGTLPDGRHYEVPTYSLACGRSCVSGGTLLESTDRTIEYLGASVSFTKRLAHQWMARGYFTYGQSEWVIGDEFYTLSAPNQNQLGTDIDDGLHAGVHTGKYSLAVLHSDWMANLNGMYQVAPDRPWGFNVAANLYGREGYPSPYYRESIGAQDGIPRDIRVVDQIDDFKTDDILTVDLRLEKEFSASGQTGFTFSIDVFNLLNEDYALLRQLNLNAGTGGYLRSTLPPRTWRLGVRISWR